MAVLLSFCSFDETRISAARSRRWFGSLTHDAHYELRGCHASKSVFPFRYERVAAKQSLQMALGREDFSVTRTDGRADVFSLAGFFRDDDLIGHNGS
jgi:hypothetical protein